MERLTERNPSWIDDELWERACEPDCEEIDAVYRKLKDYEDAEEHGTYVMVVWREYGWVTVENNSDDLCPLDDFTINHFYVVGNIFDNPELLEV